MNKRLILSLSTIALLSTSLFANMHQEKMGMPHGDMKKERCMKGMHKPHGGMQENMIIGKIMMLDLTKEQKDKIDTIMSEFKADLKDPYEAFSESSFDKDKFVEAQQNNIKMMLKNRAELIEKVYAVLTKAQKKDFKTLLNSDRIMKNKKFENRMGGMPKPEFQG